jgi:alpha-beta hydrolase superfamily lysophospholipase
VLFPTRQTLVLIHGLWTTALIWERWVHRYSAGGHRVIVRAWPRLADRVEDVRRNSGCLAGLRLGEVVDHYAHVVRELDALPILIGHGLGALVTLLLVSRGLGAAGVAICPMSAAALPDPLLENQIAPLSAQAFHRAFTHTLTENESWRMYSRYAIPGPGPFALRSVLSRRPPPKQASNFRNGRRAPLLFVAGEQDRLAPPSSVRANAVLHCSSSARTDFREYPGRTHFIVGQKGWREVADDALAWAMASQHDAPTAPGPFAIAS